MPDLHRDFALQLCVVSLMAEDLWSNSLAQVHKVHKVHKACVQRPGWTSWLLDMPAKPWAVLAQQLPNHWKSWPRGHWFIDASRIKLTFLCAMIHTFVLSLHSQFWSSWQFWHGLPTFDWRWKSILSTRSSKASKTWPRYFATCPVEICWNLILVYWSELIPPFSVVLSRPVFQRTLQWALSLGEQHPLNVAPHS